MEAQNLYNKVLKNEVLIPSMKFDWVEMEHSEYSELFSDIMSLGLRFFLGFTEEIYEDMVWEFYANLIVIRSNVDTGMHLKSCIKGKEIFICEQNLSIWLKLPTGGVRPRAFLLDFEILRHEGGDTDEEAEENYGYTEEKGDDVLARLCSDHSPPYEAMDLPLKYRLLHYAINRVIYPKKASNNHITTLDKEILWHLEERRQINFTSLIIQMMRKKANLLRGELKSQTGKHKGMMYAALITFIAKLQKVDFSSYDHYPDPQSWRFTPYNLRSMKLVKTVEKGWVYSDHVAKLGLTLEGEQVPWRQRSKRAANRPSNSRPSSVRRSEVSHEDLQNIHDQLEELNDRVDGQQSMLMCLEKRIDEQHGILTRMEKSIKKIFDKLGC